jgi:hypothetical protein
MTKFYDNVINTKNEIGKIFEALESEYSVQDWKVIQKEFHDSIERDFPSIRCRINHELAEERNPIPERLIKRIKVVTLLLSVLTLGGNYNDKLYLTMVDFCTIQEVNQKNLARNINA